ncbi:MAG TPA: alpha amylase C-terminal domain-containing protein [Paludibacteraceae bacterium]|nr:alpha amylase C-terminal domain-containing protein [Paludibacteraceae bacterium]HQB69085.1 alpha amylase C-terminal domain-containing protein [Paludibacteraceae bacterium]HRS67553.1 alpha amylase C-terminal domain-containing protein [Paludibacteraceae bacterium]
MDTLKIVKNDPLLEPYAEALKGRHDYAIRKEKELLGSDNKTLSDFASGYLYFGLHKIKRSWYLREWAPNATAIYVLGTFNNWQKDENYRLYPLENGVWEGKFSEKSMKHGDLFKLLIEWNGGYGERIPAWARRVVQDEHTKIFTAQVWMPEEEFKFKVKKFKPQTTPLLIYECHIGMATEEERVGTYNEFRENVLPRVIANGYNCIQIMAIQEHPYYGSFGYHVSSFFAASSRFGTPEELKQLIDEAHQNGIAVIMDIVHSHAVKNEIEGLGRFDGTPYQYFHGGDRREHPAWDSLCFNYNKNEVLHFLLSNCKFWLEEYKFDGFRFDGVTSMLYRNHGLGQDFTNYSDYYNMNQDGDALCYLTLANKLIHEVNPNAITIAEEMSGLPELAAPFEDGGMGFDYRMAMGLPDFWIKYIKEVKDEDWKAGHIFWEMTNRRLGEKTISYAESHDQALVGDKTIIFRLIDADMYWHMQKGDQTFLVNRGIALHKMIRLITASTINGGYLNFMGNEFGHPEWIDFPREGNGWSYKYARRQWSLADNKDYLYHDLGEFDKAMIDLLKSYKKFNETSIEKVWDNEGDQLVAYKRKDLLFVFNFNGQKSFTDYGLLVKKGAYEIVLNTDDHRFGGFGFNDNNIVHFTLPSHLKNKEWLKLYIPSRTALVLRHKK